MKYRVGDTSDVFYNGKKVTEAKLFEEKNGSYIFVWAGYVPGWKLSEEELFAAVMYEYEYETEI